MKPSWGDHEGKLAYEIATDSAQQIYHVYLFEQVAMGKLDMISDLIAGGVPVDITDGSKLNENPIHWACSFNNLEVTQLLITRGSFVDSINNEGSSPLHLAVKNKNVDLTQFLLLEGADTTIKDKHGKLPIDYISPSPSTGTLDNNQISILELLKNPPSPKREFTNMYIESQQNNKEEQQSKQSNDMEPSTFNSAEEETPVNGAHKKTTNGHSGQSSGLIVSDAHQALVENSVDNNQSNVAAADSPQIVLWPPTQQQHSSSSIPLVLSSSSELSVYIHHSIDISISNNLLDRSGIMDLFEKLNFSVSANTSNYHLSKVKLYINSNLCSGLNFI